nr:hypothetical protein CFP56_33879 [Quercus suber]
MVFHDAKECNVWLSNKGSLSLNQQEYGSWLRADPFSVGKKSFMFVPGTGGDFDGEDNPVRSGNGSDRRSQEAEMPQVVVARLAELDTSTEDQNLATGVDGAHEPRGTRTEYSPLTQLKAKDGVSDKEPDYLHENGRVNGLVGKQEGKMMKLEDSASNGQKS